MTYVEDFVPLTVCANCKHFICRGKIWYDQFCGAEETQAKKAVNPVSGKVGYVRQNDFGTTYYDEQSSPFARDINNGQCPHFKEKENE